MRRQVPWSTWVVGWLAVMVLAAGVAEAFAEHRRPVVETTVEDVRVLPEGQVEVTGTITSLQGRDVIGAPLPLPIELASGTATIEGAPETVVWDGGRPFRLEGDGGLDLGPAVVAIAADGAATWTIEGVRVLLPGGYEVRSPVAVGEGGLARALDRFAFRAGDDTTIELGPGATVRVPPAALHLEGPGSLVLDGDLRVRSNDGVRKVSRLSFGPGPLVVDLEPGPTGLRITATLRGPVA